MLKAILKLFGCEYRLPWHMDAVPFEDAVLCQNCRLITRMTQHGRCPFCKSESILALRNSVIGRDDA